MEQTCPELFTVGHSTHPIGEFLDLLAGHGIDMLADVRSHPRSRRLPHFNRDKIAESLAAAGIEYVFLGRELGARREEPECYVGNRADYDLIADAPSFQKGLDRVRQYAQQRRLALMCAEKEPLDCHRAVLICREVRHELSIRHIHFDGHIEPHGAFERRLIARHGSSRPLFSPALGDDDALCTAYARRGLEIAYQRSSK